MVLIVICDVIRVINKVVNKNVIVFACQLLSGATYGQLTELCFCFFFLCFFGTQPESSVEKKNVTDVSSFPPLVHTTSITTTTSAISSSTSATSSNNNTLRKRVTSQRKPAAVNNNDKSALYIPTQKSFDSYVVGQKTTLSCPFGKNRSAEDFGGGRPLSDAGRNDEKAHLICYKDDTITTKTTTKIIALKTSDSKINYNTFDAKSRDNRAGVGKITKYRSLDSAEIVPGDVSHLNRTVPGDVGHYLNKTLQMNSGKKHKHDIIIDTVDAWAKKSSQNVFSNLKNSIFHKNGAKNKDAVYKPLVFGGTFPIDAPFRSDSAGGRRGSGVDKSKGNFREYGPARTFDIDRPIWVGFVIKKTEMVLFNFLFTVKLAAVA